MTCLNIILVYLNLSPLNCALSPHRPELEDERQKLVVTMSSYQRALQATEERILHTLSTVQGNILESEEAILILQQTKVKGKDWEGKGKWW